jgi:uncharacterized protein YigA (DUF484 family)
MSDKPVSARSLRRAVNELKTYVSNAQSPVWDDVRALRTEIRTLSSVKGHVESIADRFGYLEREIQRLGREALVIGGWDDLVRQLQEQRVDIQTLAACVARVENFVAQLQLQRAKPSVFYWTAENEAALRRGIRDAMAERSLGNGPLEPGK